MTTLSNESDSKQCAVLALSKCIISNCDYSILTTDYSVQSSVVNYMQLSQVHGTMVQHELAPNVISRDKHLILLTYSMLHTRELIDMRCTLPNLSNYN